MHSQNSRSGCRSLLATELVALVGESYSRAYPDIVRAQQCTELSEVIQYLRLSAAAAGGGIDADPSSLTLPDPSASNFSPIRGAGIGAGTHGLVGINVRVTGAGGGAGGTQEDAAADAAERMRLIRDVWHSRLLGVERSVDVWTELLAVRRLVLAPADDALVYLKYATMCRKEGKEQQGWRVLTKLLGYDPMTVERGSTPPAQRTANHPLVRAAYAA